MSLPTQSTQISYFHSQNPDCYLHPESELLFLRRLLTIAEEARSSSQRRMEHAIRKRRSAEKKIQLYAELYTALQVQYENLASREAGVRKQAFSAAESHASCILQMQAKHETQLNKLKAELDVLKNKAQTSAEYPAPPFQASWSGPICEWMTSYEDRWNTIINSPTTTLTFGHFPWPAFRPVRTLEDLDKQAVWEFLAIRYPGALKQGWKEDLRRWHPDKLLRLKGRICLHSRADVEAGFSICIRVMTSFQEEKRGAWN